VLRDNFFSLKKNWRETQIKNIFYSIFFKILLFLKKIEPKKNFEKKFSTFFPSHFPHQKSRSKNYDTNAKNSQAPRGLLGACDYGLCYKIAVFTASFSFRSKITPEMMFDTS